MTRRDPTPPIALALLVGALATLTACGTARRSEPLTAAPEPQSPTVRIGEKVFDRYCHSCHPGGTAGLGPALNNKPLPELAIRTQVRNGIGAMPAFEEEVISDADLTALVDYLDWLRDVDVVREKDTEDGV